MYDLTKLGFYEMMELRAKLRGVFDHAEPATFEEAAQRMVAFFREELVDDAGRPACSLVRVFRTHPLAHLDADLNAFVRETAPSVVGIPDLRCLVLIATAGDEPAWNSRHLSRGHRAIPLSSEKAVEEAPMVSQLFKQLGIDVASVLKPDLGLILDSAGTEYNVFHVQTAPGSPYIVAQEDFVKPFGIQSVIGFGGVLATGDLVAAVLFSRVPIPPPIADLFKVIGLNFKLAMLKVAGKPLFGVAKAH